jgi:hypothetical protein
MKLEGKVTKVVPKLPYSYTKLGWGDNEKLIKPAVKQKLYKSIRE